MMQIYRQAPAAKAKKAAGDNSPRAVMLAKRSSRKLRQTATAKVARAAARNTPEYKEWQRAYDQRPERLAKKRAYEQNPKRRARQRYMERKRRGYSDELAEVQERLYQFKQKAKEAQCNS